MGTVPFFPADDESARLHDLVRCFHQQAAARYRVDSLAGESLAVRRARAQIELAAQSRASVLIVGPPGSGRQHAARAIHYGAAEPGALVPVACSVLEEELIVSTVAAAQRKPDSNVSGTLLLADVDTLAPQVQAELARLVGSRGFPMRLAATSQEPLVELARQGKFREDLAQWLSTLVIELPPLAGRRGDLPLLLQLFLEETNAAGERQLAGFTPEALDALAAYRWPGNVDELIRLVRQAHEKAEGPRIGLGDLPEQIHLAADAAAHPRASRSRSSSTSSSPGSKRSCSSAVVRAKGNKTKAAKLLGISRARLIRRLAQLDI